MRNDGYGAASQGDIDPQKSYLIRWNSETKKSSWLSVNL